MYKGREPQTSDEEEMVANLFDAMCWVVMHGENKEKFVQAEGIELMLLIMKVRRRYSLVCRAYMLASFEGVFGRSGREHQPGSTAAAPAWIAT
eukprot:1185271-Pyramimonas_sp.AAC.1